MRTFGTLSIDGEKWSLEVEPHVAMRAKRMFGQMRQQRTGTLHLSITPETARDIEWFLERYPLEVDAVTKARLQAEANRSRERESLVERILSGLEKPQAFELALPPREYQRVGAQMLLSNRSLLLADELGLGKTVTAICALTDPATRPALVVTMTHLTRQWEAEIKKFAPQLSTHVIKQGKPYDLTKGKRRAADTQLELPSARASLFPDVVITNYHKLAGWSDVLASTVKSVVFDEVQELRNGTETGKGRAADYIANSAHFKLGLSATPIYNLGGEMHAVMGMLAPDALGTKDEFVREWCSTVDSKGRAKIGNPKAFGTYLRDAGLMLRRTKEDVGRELPPVSRIVHEVDIDDAPLKNIASAAENLAQVILSATEKKRGDKLQASQELDAMVRHATGVAKAPYVAEFVKMLAEQDEKVVLFGWHHDVYSVWLERLAPLNPVLFTGKQSAAQKAAAREAFIEGDSKVLIMSLRSGAGLDGLQHVCRTLVFGELDWSPGAMEQCVGRIDRDGQLRNVLAYYLIANEGSDPLVADILQVKRAQVEGIRNPKRDVLENLEVDGQRIKELAKTYLRSRNKVAAAIPNGS